MVFTFDFGNPESGNALSLLPEQIVGFRQFVDKEGQILTEILTTYGAGLGLVVPGPKAPIMADLQAQLQRAVAAQANRPPQKALWVPT